MCPKTALPRTGTRAILAVCVARDTRRQQNELHRGGGSVYKCQVTLRDLACEHAVCPKTSSADGTSKFLVRISLHTTASALPRYLLRLGPSPSPGPIHHSTAQLNSVVVGALIGAVATVIAELVARGIGNYRSYRFILNLLQEEVSDIANQVNVRKAHLEAMVPLYGPFPTKAWDALLQSRQRRYMRERRRKALSPLYKAVSEANEHVRLIPTALQISQLATQDNIRDTYRDETVRLLKDPLGAVEVALPAALQALKQAGSTNDRQTAIGGTS